MKFLILLLFLISFFSNTHSANAQWVRDSTIFGNALIYHNGYTFIGKDGVSKSSDNGQSWMRSDSGFSTLGTERKVNCFLSTGNILLAGVDIKSIYRTTNDGLNWAVSNTGLSGGFSVKCMMKKDSVIYAGGDDGVYYSTNNGSSWQVSSIQLYAKSVIALNYIGNRLIASVEPSSVAEGIYLSTNNGSSWYKSINGLHAFAHLYSITVHRNNLVFVTSDDGKIYKSTNQGSSWLLSTDASVIDPFFNPVYASASFNLSLVVGCNNGIYMSTNAGSNWFRYSFGIPPGTQFQVNSIVQCGPYIFAPGNNGTYKIPTGTIGIDQISSNIPEKFELQQNYPNPFNPVTKINFRIPLNSFIELKVCDIQGREVKTLYTGYVAVGEYGAEFDGSGLNSGIYFCTLKVTGSSGTQLVTRKMLLIK
ncbi:hypothetical protein BH10BAC5_BH10BAC5_25230 [soil metagenome]